MGRTYLTCPEPASQSETRQSTSDVGRRPGRGKVLENRGVFKNQETEEIIYCLSEVTFRYLHRKTPIFGVTCNRKFWWKYFYVKGPVSFDFNLFLFTFFFREFNLYVS